MTAEQAQFFRVLLISGERLPLDDWLDARLLSDTPYDQFVLALAACTVDVSAALSLLNEQLSALPAPDEDAVFGLLWQHVHGTDPLIPDREALALIHSLLCAADAENPHVMTLLHQDELLEDGILTERQLSGSVEAYLRTHTVPDPLISQHRSFCKG